ncbi:MAG: transmembrane 220 family protein [Myxococcota bacterium]
MSHANALFALLFAFSAVVQYNDPDPGRWIAMYCAACVTCVAWRRLPRAAPAAVGAVALAWGAWIAAGVHLTAPFGEALTDWKMHAGGSEELREALGLGIVAAWMGVLAIRR